MIYILDTNVLIHNPQAIFSYKNSKIIIPITVIEEIDGLKKNFDERGRNARQVARFLDSLRKLGSLKDGVKIKNNSIVQVSVSHKINLKTSEILINDKNDNLIIGTALLTKEENPDEDVVLVSKDANLRIKADAVGLKAENYESFKINFNELYSGYTTIILEHDIFKTIANDIEKAQNFGEFYPNQFVKLIDKENTENSIITIFKNGKLENIKYYKNQKIFGIRAKNDEQRFAFELLLDPQVQLVSLIGMAGTGKTLLALAAGLNQVVEKDNYKRLIVSRPISPIGRDLGYLPGSKEEKFNPWMQPIYDNMEILLSNKSKSASSKDEKIIFGKKGNLLKDFMDYDFIQLEPLTYIRGRSLPNQYLVIDEAQNLTPHEMKTIITRAGEGTKVVLTGDPYQIDLPYLDSETNGLSVAVERLKTEQIVGHVTLTKGERSELAELAAKFF